MKNILSKEIIKWLEIIRNETSERNFAFQLQEELEKIGLIDEELNRLCYLYWEIEDLNYKISERYLKGIDN